MMRARFHHPWSRRGRELTAHRRAWLTEFYRANGMLPPEPGTVIQFPKPHKEELRHATNADL